MANVTTELKIAVDVAGAKGLETLKRSLTNIGKQANLADKTFNQFGKKLARLQQQTGTNTISQLRNYSEAWRSIASQVDIGSAAFVKATREAERLEKRLERVSSRRGGRLRAGAQIAGTIAGAGVFGGPEGAIGAGIGAIGGTGGAIVGGAIGAQVGQLRQAIGETATYTASIEKLKIALQGVAGSQLSYAQALQIAEDAVRNLNVPQETAIAGITRLTAAVKGAGGEVTDAGLVFQNITKAIKATGGGAQDVQGAITAMVQVFSKGKVSAEELSGQLGERLPGAVTLFAKANELSLPQLQKLLKEGSVGLNELMNFVQLLGTEYGETALKMAASTEDAGARLQIAFNDMKLSIGDSIQPIGAELQEVFGEFIRDSIPALTVGAEAAAQAFLLMAKGIQAVIQNLKELAIGFAAAGVAIAAIKLPALVTGLGVSLVIALAKGTTATAIFSAALAKLNLIALANPYVALAAGVTALGFAIAKNRREQAEFNALLDDGAGSTEKLKNTKNELQKKLDAVKGRIDGTATGFKATGREAKGLRRQVRELEGQLKRISKTYTARLSLEKRGFEFSEDGKTKFYTVAGIKYDAASGKAVSLADGSPLTKFKPPTAEDGDGSKIREISANRLNIEQQLLDAKEAGDKLKVAELTRDARLAEIAEQKLGPNLRLLEQDKARTQFALTKQRIDEQEAQRLQRIAQANASLNQKYDEARLKLGEITEEQKLQLDADRLRTQLIESLKQALGETAVISDELKKKIDKIVEAFSKTTSRADDLKKSFKEQLKNATDLENNIRERLQGAVFELGDAFADFVVTGKNSFREFTASVLRDLGRMIVKAAFLKTLSTFLAPTGLGKFLGFADGGVFAQNKIVPFAYGGVVNKPTLFPMANGTGLMGEQGPEAIMPLRRNSSGRLGVEASGGGTTTVNVSVDAKGSSVQGDSSQAKQLGNAIGAAVQAELLKQKRPGGLLAGV